MDKRVFLQRMCLAEESRRGISEGDLLRMALKAWDVIERMCSDPGEAKGCDGCKWVAAARHCVLGSEHCSRRAEDHYCTEGEDE